MSFQINLLPVFALAALTVHPARSQITYQCYNGYSCALQTIEDDTSSRIECYGYNSCAQATKIDSTNSPNIQCFGSYSCYDVNLIQHTGTTWAHIQC